MEQSLFNTGELRLWLVNGRSDERAEEEEGGRVQCTYDGWRQLWTA